MPSATTYAIAVQGLIVLFLAYRSVQAYPGRHLSPARLFVFPVFTLLIFLATEAETVASIPAAYPVWAIVDAVALVVAAVVTVPVTPRFVQVTEVAPGDYVYRYGIELIALYLGLWIVRFALAALYDPSSLAFDFSSSPSALSGTPATVMLIVQALFAISTGVVVGRSVGTYRLYERENPPPPLPGA